MPELRGDERLQLMGAGAGSGRASPARIPLAARLRPADPVETGLAVFVALEALFVAGRRAGWDVLLWWHPEAWPVTLGLWLGVLLAASAAALAAVALLRLAARGEAAASRGPATATATAVAAAALLAGAALRFLPPGDVPPGLFADTVYGALPVLRAPDGGWLAGGRYEGGAAMAVSPVFLPVVRAVLGVAGGGEEGFAALSAVSGLLAVGGVGALAVAAAGRTVALLVVPLAALAGWPLRLSRWAWGESLTVAVLSGAAAAAIVADRRRSRAWAAAAGTLAGLAVHGHPSGLVVAGVLGIAAACLSLRDRSRWRLIAAAALPFALALGLWAAVHLRWTGGASTRYGQVGVWAESRRAELARVPEPLRVPAAIGFNLAEYGGVLFATGDPNARMGIPLRPLLSPLLGVAALAGFGLLARDALRGDRGAQALAAVAAGSLLAGIAANPDGAPNSLRVCALLAPALVASARGLRALSAALPAERLRPSLRAALLGAVLVSFEVVPALVEWPARPDVGAAFFEGQTAAGRVLRVLAEAPVAVDPGVVPHPDVLAAVARGGRPLRAVSPPPRRSPSELARDAAPRRLWYVTDESGASVLAGAGLAVSRPAAPGPAVVLVVR